MHDVPARDAEVVNWFSPLPPERSGIAEFTAMLAPYLRQRATTRFIAQSLAAGSDAFPGGESLADVSQAAVNHAAANFFNIGNNAKFHEEIWQQSTAAAGIVILHDARLQHLFGGIFLQNRKDRGGYIALMRDTYGIAGEAAAHLMATGRASVETVAEAFPLVEVAVRGAAGVVIHSDEALRLIRERTQVPAIKLNLPYDAGPPPVYVRGIGDDAERPLRIVAFGHIGPNRSIDKVLRAVAGVRGVRACHLHLIGEVWNERQLRDLAQELGIGARLTFHGHLPDALLDDHLSRADLVVNLRYPTMGEASYSQLRSMRHAVPTLVSRAGWYGELPSDTVIHVTPGQEIAEVAEVLSALGAHAEEFRAIGERGRNLLVTDHAPAAYAEGAFAFAAEQARSIRPIAEALASKIAREVVPLGRSGDLLVEAAAHCGDFMTDIYRTPDPRT